MRKSDVSLFAASIVLAMLAACSPEPAPAPAPAAPDAAASAPAAPRIVLPVSINEVMVALVDHASEPMWLDAYEPPKTDEGWLETRYNAYQIAVSGKLIQLPGIGPNDEDWVGSPEWRTMADEMSSAGLQALRAAEAKNAADLNSAGDRLVAACEACHKQFKPGLTSMGVYKSPKYPAPKK
jgi:hypothetical protein